MEETALAFTDYASYCLTNILLLQNSLTFPWLWLIFQISLTNFKIPWLFPDLEKNSFFPDFSLTVGTLWLSWQELPPTTYLRPDMGHLLVHDTLHVRVAVPELAAPVDNPAVAALQDIPAHTTNTDLWPSTLTPDPQHCPLNLNTNPWPSKPLVEYLTMILYTKYGRSWPCDLRQVVFENCI